MDGLSASDIAMLSNENGMGGNAFLWIFALLILAGGGFGGFGFNRNGELNQYATAASQQEILFGQQFQNLNSAINKVGDGLASLGYSQLQQMTNDTASINANVINEGRNIQTQLCAINSNIDNKFAALEKSQLEQRIAEQSQAINQLQMAQALCGVPRVNPYMYNISPNCGCGCTGLATI